MIKAIDECIELSKKSNGESINYDCNFFHKENNDIYKVHSADISHREIALNTDKAILSYVVDTIGFNDYIELNEVIE